MTARLVGLGLVTMAAMVLAVPGVSQGAPKGGNCVCAEPQVKPTARPAARTQARSQAYAERFYNYWQAAPVSMRDWHGEWRVAPDVWEGSPYAGGYYAGDQYAGGYHDGGYSQGGAYGPAAYAEQPGLSIDRGGWSGGVGGVGIGGGGGGGGGAVVIARGGRGLNGPTYNDYNQSFQYNPSQAGPWLNRVPQSSGGGSGGSK